jgi:hypothetical protein
MNLFLAAVYTNGYMRGQNRYLKLNEVEQSITPKIPHILESYHYVHSQKDVDAMRADGAQVFLDSGAFSAHSLGVAIDINAYCDYIKRNEDILRKEDGIVMASVLDGIGDPLQTYRNQLYMESQNAKPLPCFHFGEDIRYLEWYVANYDYITIGGLVRKTAEAQRVWLDRIWPVMLDGSGRPKLKVHAFGMTAPWLMERYPWYSVDSSSWIQAAAFGSIFTSEHGPIAVSESSPSKHDRGRHLTTLPDIERAAVEKMLAGKGFNYERLSTIYESRAVYNILGYCELNDIINRKLEARNGDLDVLKIQELF